MARKKQLKAASLSPEQAVQFLEDMRNLVAQKDEKTRLISLRVPENILRTLKVQARSQGKKYQSLLIEHLRFAIKNNTKR